MNMIYGFVLLVILMIIGIVNYRYTIKQAKYLAEDFESAVKQPRSPGPS